MDGITVTDATVAVAQRALLERVSLRAVPGEMLAVVGANGAGKTTLLRAIAGLHPFERGSATVDGMDLRRASPSQRARRIGLISNDDGAPEPIAVRAVVESGRYAHGAWWRWTATERDDRAVQEAMEKVGVCELAGRSFDTLSSGERQRVWLALSLAQEARVLLLDEPTSHLDIRFAVEVLQLLRRLAREGLTVVSVLHDLNEAAAFADRIALLGGGTLLACGRPREVLHAQLLERAYGVALDVIIEGDEVHVFPRPPG